MLGIHYESKLALSSFLVMFRSRLFPTCISPFFPLATHSLSSGNTVLMNKVVETVSLGRHIMKIEVVDHENGESKRSLQDEGMKWKRFLEAVRILQEFWCLLCLS